MERGNTRNFNAANMLEDLDGGSLLDQISHAVHEVAKSVVHHGDGRKKGKVTLELNFDTIRGASQVMIAHKLAYKQLTAKGDLTETRGDEAPMHVTRTGVTATPDGQLDFVQQQAVADEKKEE